MGALPSSNTIMPPPASRFIELDTVLSLVSDDSIRQEKSIIFGLALELAAFIIAGLLVLRKVVALDPFVSLDDQTGITMETGASPSAALPFALLSPIA